MKPSARTVLEGARRQIDSPSKWVKGRYAAGPWAGRLDASGAMYVALGSIFDDRDEHPATRVLREVTPARYERLSDFNDAHSHAEVMALFEKAIRRTYR